MRPDSLPTRASLSAQADGPAPITSSLAIYATLSTLVETRQVISIWHALTSAHWFTTLMAFDPENGLVYFEPNGELPDNTSFLRGGCLCFAQLHQKKIQFQLPGIKIGRYLESPAWISRLPLAIEQQQQREHFRAPVPINRPCFCRIRGIHAFACPEEIRVQLVDLSPSGIGFIAPLIMGGTFTAGAVFHHCELQLFGQTPFPVSIKVRTAAAVTSKSGIRAVRVGAEIVGIHRRQTLILEELTNTLISTETPKSNLTRLWGKASTVPRPFGSGSTSSVRLPAQSGIGKNPRSKLH